MNKVLGLSMAFWASAQFWVQAQPVQTSKGEAQKETATRAIERGMNHSVVQTIRNSVSMDGREITVTNKYVQLESGLNYFDEKEQVWKESQPVIRLVEGGAIGDTTPHKVAWAANANTPGAIHLATPDGQSIRSHFLCLVLVDAATDKSTVIAHIVNSQGHVHQPNVIVYPGALENKDGMVIGSLRYVYTKAGLEQDIVLTEPIEPRDYGIAPENAVLMAYTEILESPEPKLNAHQPDGKAALLSEKHGLEDSSLSFGSMLIGHGKAFSLPEQPDARPLDGIPVGKSWIKDNGRTYLIESVVFSEIEPELKKLRKEVGAAVETNVERRTSNIERSTANRTGDNPQLTTNPEPRTKNQTQLTKNQERRTRNILSQLRRSRGNETLTSKQSNQPIKQIAMTIAQKPLQPPGFVLDYATININTNNMTFKSGVTYFISGQITFAGATILEGGCVIKYDPNSKMELRGSLDCRTEEYLPAIFTAKDDNSIGESISGSSGNPFGSYYAAPALEFTTTSPDLHDIRISHAQEAVAFTSGTGTSNTLSHAQIIRCQRGINPQKTPLSLRNVLFGQVQTVFTNASTSVTVNAEHLTVSESFALKSSYITLNLTNSLLVAVTNAGSYNGTGNGTESSVSGVFSSVGSGNYYLASGSTHRDTVTTNINNTLLAALKKKTTYPPTALSNVLYTTDQTLGIQAPRDSDTLDQGYHYAALDYALNSYQITNALLTVEAGVALAPFNGTGIWLKDRSSLDMTGTPNNPIRMVHHYFIQEQSQRWGTNSTFTTVNPYNYGTSPSARYRFCESYSSFDKHFYLLETAGGRWSYSRVDFRDCAFYGPAQAIIDIETSGATYPHTFTNVLFVGGAFNFENWGTFVLQNCLFKNGWLFFYLSSSSPSALNIHDTVFDNVILDDWSATTYTHSHNAYIGGVTRLLPNNANDVVLASFSYASGPLGKYYHGQTDLVNRGSANADTLGLYHFTTQTNQAKETNSTVDIGYLYASCGADGLACDADSDGFPDCIEDYNGNGIFDASESESDWQNYSTVTKKIPGISVHTPIKR